jgi:hypothetical protein
MEDVVDLDDLAPKSAIIKFGNQEIEVPPPKVGSLLRVGNLAGKVKEATEGSEEELDAAVDNLTKQIYKMIPALEGKPLSLMQLQKLVGMFNEMSIPEEFRALAEKGITADTSKKVQQS